MARSMEGDTKTGSFSTIGWRVEGRRPDSTFIGRVVGQSQSVRRDQVRVDDFHRLGSRRSGYTIDCRSSDTHITLHIIPSVFPK